MKTATSVPVLVAFLDVPAAVVFGQLPGEPKAPERVRAAQERLRDGGYYDGPIDGVLGPRVRRAIWNFQKQHRLSRSGRPNAATVARLEAGCAPAASPASR